MLQKLWKCEFKAHSVEIQELREVNFSKMWTSKNGFFTVLNTTLNFGKFGTWKIAQICQHANSEPLKLPKMAFLTFWIPQNLILCKIWVAVKIIFQQSQALTSHFESFWSIVLWVFSSVVRATDKNAVILTSNEQRISVYVKKKIVLYVKKPQSRTSLHTLVEGAKFCCSLWKFN